MNLSRLADKHDLDYRWLRRCVASLLETDQIVITSKRHRTMVIERQDEK